MHLTQNFARGYFGENPCRRARPAPAPKSADNSRRFQSDSPSIFPPFFSHFQSRLSVVAGFAQALEIAPVGKHGPVPPVGRDVIHHRGPGPVPGISGRIPRSADAAERLPQELRRAKIVRPDGQAVPTVVLRRDLAGRFGWLVSRTISITGQGRAPRVPAGPERLQNHGLSPPGERKSQNRRSPRVGEIIGSGFWSTGPVRYSRLSPHGRPGSKPSGASRKYPPGRGGSSAAGRLDR